MKSLAYKIYSVIAIIIFGSGYILANYFPEQAEKLGLGWLNSHKSVTTETPAWRCHLSWDWGRGTAVMGSNIDYQINCTAKVQLSLDDFYIFISETNHHQNKMGPSGKSNTHQGSAHLSKKGPLQLKTGDNYQQKGSLNILRLGNDKNTQTRRELVLSARIHYGNKAPSFPEGSDPHRLFVYTGLY